MRGSGTSSFASQLCWYWRRHLLGGDAPVIQTSSGSGTSSAGQLSATLPTGRTKAQRPLPAQKHHS
eukprot:3303271-Amphidinium_carterae.1